MIGSRSRRSSQCRVRSVARSGSVTPAAATPNAEVEVMTCFSSRTCGGAAAHAALAEAKTARAVAEWLRRTTRRLTFSPGRFMCYDASDPMSSRTTRIALLVLIAIILVAAAVLRMSGIGTNPPGLWQDEASTGFDAYLLWTTARDRAG